MGSGAGAAAGAARAAGAGALVHVSAIGADAAWEIAYARAKAAGEAAVLAAFPAATVLRPSVLFGPDDTFINRFAGLIARFPAMPVSTAGGTPAGVRRRCGIGNRQCAGRSGRSRRQDLRSGGPERLTMAQLNRMIAKAARRAPLFLDLPMAFPGLIVTLTGWLPGAPISGQQ